MIPEAYSRSHSKDPVPGSQQPMLECLVLAGYKVTFRWSRNRVPHFVVESNGRGFSVCWFKRPKVYRVFYPYPGENQTRRDYRTPEEVVKYIDQMSI